MSDYSPPYTDADAKLDKRIEKADKEIRKVMLGSLTVEDLFVILDVYKYGYIGQYDSAVSRIEKILYRR
jgi:hypothetical protein